MERKKAKTSTASVEEVVEQSDLDIDAKLGNFKVYKLIDIVGKMGDKFQTHASAAPLSLVLAAHSSRRVEESGTKQLPTFEELKSDAQIQLQVLKRLHQYDHILTKQFFKGKSTGAIVKSGPYRVGIPRLRRISWSQDF